MFPVVVVVVVVHPSDGYRVSLAHKLASTFTPKALTAVARKAMDRFVGSYIPLNTAVINFQGILLNGIG